MYIYIYIRIFSKSQIYYDYPLSVLIKLKPLLFSCSGSIQACSQIFLLLNLFFVSHVKFFIGNAQIYLNLHYCCSIYYLHFLTSVPIHSLDFMILILFNNVVLCSPYISIFFLILQSDPFRHYDSTSLYSFQFSSRSYY